MKSIIKLFVIICIAFLISCGDSTKITIKGFDSEKWKIDKLGCLNQRREISNLLVDSNNLLIGRSKNAVIQFLGQPDYEKNNSYFYFVEPSDLQCDGKITKRGYDSLDVRQIKIGFNIFDNVNSVLSFVR